MTNLVVLFLKDFFINTIFVSRHFIGKLVLEISLNSLAIYRYLEQKSHWKFAVMIRQWARKVVNVGDKKWTS